VVTGIGTDGRSMIVSDADAPGGDPMAGLWRTDPAPGPEGYDGEVDLTRLEPPAGGTSWRVFDLPPDEVVAEYLARQEIPGVESDGFPRTETVDYVMVLEGEVTLELDEGSVDLSTGDCVVQRGTRHAWRNRTGRPVRMAVVMVSTRDGEAAS